MVLEQLSFQNSISSHNWASQDAISWNFRQDLMPKLQLARNQIAMTTSGFPQIPSPESPDLHHFINEPKGEKEKKYNPHNFLEGGA